MDIINFGSLNLDYVYNVDHFVNPGETLASENLAVFCGGKGLNQSIAAARAGAHVIHAGVIGESGEMLYNQLQKSGVDTSFLQHTLEKQGHAVIQISKNGDNCILLFRGSNFQITVNYIDHVFSKISPPAYIVLQNEISNVPYIIQRAHDLGFSVVLNASPIDSELLSADLNCVKWLMINEIEGKQITGKDSSDEILQVLSEKYPRLGVVLTLGKKGVICINGTQRVQHGIYHVPVVDTTAAGDTFTGFFIAALALGKSLEKAVSEASVASSIAVSRKGAAPSIPTISEVASANLDIQE